MDEEWRDVVGYEGLYQVSSCGRVKSLNYRNTEKEGILSGKPNSSGYLIVGLSKNKKRKPFYIHRLVAKAFIPNPNNYPEVNHIDEDKSNNHVDNLEWCTARYNVNYGTRNERCSEKMKGIKKDKSTLLYGEKHQFSKKVKCITTGEIFNCMSDAERKYNIYKGEVSKCCKGKRKYAGKHPVTGEKLVWEYV